MAYIAYSTPKANGAVYATVVESTREGSKVKQQRIENLGRVIDVQKGIFKNRKRGVFRYTLEDGFMDADIPAPDSASIQPAPEKLILDFGDSYVLDRYIHTLPFFHVISDIMPLQRDTLFSLLFYRMLTDKKAYCYADTWWSGNYARLLYPGARLQSQRVSEFLAALGEEALQRQFFGSYLSALYGDSEKTAGILIDSTGLENASKMSITQLNNHNGDINMEIRLTYVIDRRNGMPVYFRYCPGNIVDVSTLCTTVAELSQYGVSTDYAIVDAGYFSEDNVKELYRNGIRFVTRLAPNRKIYKQVVLCQEKVQVKRGLFVESMESYSTVFCDHVFQIIQFGYHLFTEFLNPIHDVFQQITQFCSLPNQCLHVFRLHPALPPFILSIPPLSPASHSNS